MGFGRLPTNDFTGGANATVINDASSSSSVHGCVTFIQKWIEVISDMYNGEYSKALLNILLLLPSTYLLFSGVLGHVCPPYARYMERFSSKLSAPLKKLWEFVIQKLREKEENQEEEREEEQKEEQEEKREEEQKEEQEEEQEEFTDAADHFPDIRINVDVDKNTILIPESTEHKTISEMFKKEKKLTPNLLSC
ncbi:unnamed protein product [Caenorhabditis brenneri]